MFRLGLFSSDSSVQGSSTKSRLQKAIERNRLKQEKKINKRGMGLSKGARETVGRPDNIQFTNIRGRRSATFANSNGRSTLERVPSAFKDKLIKVITILGWVSCFLFFGQLVIGDRGVIDFYKLDNEYQNILNKYESIIADNKRISEKIIRIKKDISYQKKLVRDNLGFISKNEYLILFQNARSSSPF